MGYTLYKKQLTPQLKEIILDFVVTNNSSPTGIWRDFHCVHRSWRNLQLFIDEGLLSEDDLPDEPNPSDYPDTASEVTLQCPESCCKNCNRIYGCNCAFCSGVL